MNIRQVQSYFEQWNDLRDTRPCALQFDDGGAYGNFGDLRLDSVFQPIVSGLDGRTTAHEALLRARSSTRWRLNCPKPQAPWFTSIVSAAWCTR